MKTVVVHRSAHAAADTVIERLQENGVEAFALDQPNAIALLFSFGTYRVRIAVPEDQAAEAQRVLLEWDREAAPHVGELARVVRRQFALAALVAVAFGTVFFVRGEGAEDVPWILLPLVWFLALLALGVLERWRQSRV